MSIIAAQTIATDLRRELEITDRCFDLLDLLDELEVTVSFEKPVGGAEALSHTSGTDDLILVDPSLNKPRLRFTLGHELGHLLLGHGSSCCTAQDIHSLSTNHHEAEANAFSANLLLPARLFRRDIRSAHLRKDEIVSLAERYGTSLTATAIRFTDLTSDPCAVVGVRSSEPPWIAPSKKIGWWITLPPSPETLVAECAAGANISFSASTPAEHWIENFSWRGEWHITEEVVQTGPDSWLTLLSEFPDKDDDPDLIDREVDEELERRRMSFRRY